MGQYYVVVNLDKKEYIDPSEFGDQITRLFYIGKSGRGAMSVLVSLLMDLPAKNPFVGRWSGDRIVVSGDYAEAGKFLKGENLYNLAMEGGFKNIGEYGMKAMLKTIEAARKNDFILEIVNLDMDRRINSASFNETLIDVLDVDGVGTKTALSLLLADGHGQGNGDPLCSSPLIGSWAGSRIVARTKKTKTSEISKEVILALVEDEDLLRDLKKNLSASQRKWLRDELIAIANCNS